MDNGELDERVPWDVDDSQYDLKEPVRVTLTLELPAGLWNWVRSKADYEGMTHEVEVVSLIQMQRDLAILHGKRAKGEA